MPGFTIRIPESSPNLKNKQLKSLFDIVYMGSKYLHRSFQIKTQVFSKHLFPFLIEEGYKQTT